MEINLIIKSFKRIEPRSRAKDQVAIYNLIFEGKTIDDADRTPAIRGIRLFQDSIDQHMYIRMPQSKTSKGAFLNIILLPDNILLSLEKLIIEQEIEYQNQKNNKSKAKPNEQ